MDASQAAGIGRTEKQAMARTRNIKPGFFKNDTLAECQPLARILFAGLWTIADRNGRCEYRPKFIKAECLPYDDCSVAELMAELESRGFIRVYDADGKRYFDIPTFGAHQNPHPKEQNRNIPANPCKTTASNLLATDKPLSSNCLAGPSPNHLVPSSSYPSPNHTDPEHAPADGCELEYAEDGDMLEHPERHDEPAAIATKPAKAPSKPRPAFSVCDVEFPPELDTLACRDAAERWLEHKRVRRESYKSAASFRIKLAELARAGPEAFVAAVDSSIGNNYAGIYSPKDARNGNRNEPTAGQQHQPGRKLAGGF